MKPAPAVGSTLFNAVIAIATLCWALPASASCTSDYGEVVDFRQCGDHVILPDVEIRALGGSRPNPDVPVYCHNYEASVEAGAATAFRNCSTGVLGGTTDFAVAGRKFTAVFDLSIGCERHRNGHWVTSGRGHVFFTDPPGLEAARTLWKQRADAERDCSARSATD